MTASVKNKSRVIVIGDSLLKGTEGPICQPDSSHREVCCLPGAGVRDVATKLPGLMQPSDYYPLLVMQVGGDELVERSPKAIKRDFRALGRLVEGSTAHVVFSSIPSVAGKSTERHRKTHLINRWLRDWCHRWNFVFFDHGEVYMAPGQEFCLFHLILLPIPAGGRVDRATVWPFVASQGQQMESSCLKGEKGFLPTSGRAH